MARRHRHATARATSLFRPGSRRLRDAGGEPEPGADLVDGLDLGPGLKPSSAAVYARDIAAWLAWWTDNPARATPQDVYAFLAGICPTPSSWDRRRAALVRFYALGIRAGRWTNNPGAVVPRMRRGDWRCPQ